MDSDSRPDTPPATAKTCALTPSQREPKRAADRKTHRQLREKMNSYIAHLERLLDTAATSDTTTNAEHYRF
ncbi:hypothetical protein GX50_04319 [[Emmonsia] crescens]|uniref:Uncharacterized protein n=1 Tax=[Emmonsia] crescens TaxID=73230 RepID=A0A2B7ZFZ7_9EURO|nr:hypothetical protein GX50_04319 [Emmonsia crescens]